MSVTAVAQRIYSLCGNVKLCVKVLLHGLHSDAVACTNTLPNQSGVAVERLSTHMNDGGKNRRQRMLRVTWRQVAEQATHEHHEKHWRRAHNNVIKKRCYYNEGICRPLEQGSGAVAIGLTAKPLLDSIEENPDRRVRNSWYVAHGLNILRLAIIRSWTVALQCRTALLHDARSDKQHEQTCL